MTNINLLPPEIAEKRKVERRRMYLFAGGAAAIGMVVLVYVFVGVQIAGEKRQVEELQAKASRLSTAKTQLQQFADRKAELQKKQKVAQDVIADEVDWAKILNEVSMIIPTDVWLASIKGNETNGMTFQGWALEQTGTVEATQTGKQSAETTVTDTVGHKAVAKWLVRQSLINELKDIWLTNSNFLPNGFENQPAIQFESTAAWRTPHAPPASASAPTAPPAANPAPSGSAPGG